MRKRRSWRQIERDFRAVAPPTPERAATKATSLPILNGHDRARARREAEKERLREIVRATLAGEQND